MKKKPLTDAENIIIPAMKIALEAMVNTEAIEKVRLIPLSADTMARKIKDMSDDIDLQIKEHFSDNSGLSKLWALQIDESTDISNKAQLLAYIRIFKNGSILNQFFFCSELKETTTGEDVFELVDLNVKLRGIKWENCESVCADGAPAMQGRKSNFIFKIIQM